MEKLDESARGTCKCIVWGVGDKEGGGELGRLFISDYWDVYGDYIIRSCYPFSTYEMEKLDEPTRGTCRFWGRGGGSWVWDQVLNGRRVEVWVQDCCKKIVSMEITLNKKPLSVFSYL